MASPDLQGGDAAILHEGRRVFAGGRSMWVTIAIVTVGLGAPVVQLLFIGPETLPLVLSVLVGSWVVVVAMLLRAGRDRIRITNDEVHIRRSRGTRVIPRAGIATVLHARKRTSGLRRTGYVALLDYADQPLWGSPSHIWPPDTIRALKRTGRELTIGTLSRKQPDP